LSSRYQVTSTPQAYMSQYNISKADAINLTCINKPFEAKMFSEFGT
jgi:hypothetical protein